MHRQDPNPPVVLVFLDAEFTCLERPELISIGLSATDGSEFYGERTDYPRARCSDFVRAEVLPKLGWSWHQQGTLEELAHRARDWLARKTEIQVPVLVYDYEDDLRLLTDLLTPGLASMVASINVRQEVCEERLQEYFQRSDVLRHHALHDAKALGWACAPWVQRIEADLALLARRLTGIPRERELQFLRQSRPELGNASPIQALCTGRVAEVLESGAAFVLNFRGEVEQLEARMRSKAAEAVWAGTEWLTSEQLAARSCRLSQDELRQAVRDRKILSLELDGEDVYPAYAFDSSYSLLPQMGMVLAELPAHFVGWLAASFFESTQSSLDGRRVRELLQEEPQRAVRAAADERDTRVNAS